MTFLLIVIAMSSGGPTREYKYPMPTRDDCLNAIVSATYTKGMINTAFTAFCVPAQEAPKNDESPASR